MWCFRVNEGFKDSRLRVERLWVEGVGAWGRWRFMV